ncbi:MAG: Ldh family oxidoreductase [Methylotenera sp.]
MHIQGSVLQDICVSILSQHDVPAGDAELVANTLVEANLRGYDSHGVIRLPLWVEGLTRGTIKARPNIKIKTQKAASALVDGDYGLGPVVGEYVTKLAMDRAQEFGISAVSVQHASHLSMLSYYAEKAARKKLIAIIMTNTEPAMAPHGGREKILGTNPICIAVPAEPNPHILDISSSIVARGKLLVAKSKKESIPEAWALDKSGKPTTNPADALDGALRSASTRQPSAFTRHSHAS